MNHNSSYRIHNPRSDLEQLEANRSYLRIGQLCISKAFASKRIHQDIGGCRQQHTKLNNNRPGQFYEEQYIIPIDIIKDKNGAGDPSLTKATVLFTSQPGKMIGHVFLLRVVHTEKKP